MKSKKIAVILSAAACALILAVAGAVTLFANNNAPTINMSSPKGKPGETVDVVLSLENPVDICGIEFNLGYDSDILTVTDFKIVETGLFACAGEVVNPKDFADDGAMKKNPLYFGWTNGLKDFNVGGDFAIVTFLISDTAENGAVNLTLECTDSFDKDDNNVEIVIANNGTSIITVDDGKSDDATLQSLTISNGTIEPAFNANTTDYTVLIPYGESVPTVSAVSTDKNASVAVTQAESFEDDKNTATIKVTAENGKVVKTYTITFTQQERTETPQITTDNTQPLSRNNGTIEISGNGTIYYTIDGKEPTAQSTKYTEAISIKSLNLPVSTESLTIKAAAIEDGKAASEIVSKTFTLKSIDAALSSLTVDGKSVDNFNSNEYKYTYTVSYADWVKDKEHEFKVVGTASKGSVTNPPAAFITIDDSDEGSEMKFEVTVTPEEGDEVTYTVIIKILPCTHTEWSEEVTLEPCCVATGLKNRICTVCEKTEKDIEIPALGHEWSEEKTVVSPTCTVDGEEYYKCTRENCDVSDAKKDKTVIDKLGHNWGAWSAAEDGVTYSRICSNDDTHKETQTVEAAEDGHTHSFTVASESDSDKPATCQMEGMETVKCDKCDVTINQSVPTIAHKPISAGDKNVEPTCTTAGHSYTKCEICNTILTDTEIPANGHKFSSGYEYDANGHWHVCSICGTKSEIERHSGTCAICGYTVETPDSPDYIVPSYTNITYPVVVPTSGVLAVKTASANEIFEAVAKLDDDNNIATVEATSLKQLFIKSTALKTLAEKENAILEIKTPDIIISIDSQNAAKVNFLNLSTRKISLSNRRCFISFKNKKDFGCDVKITVVGCKLSQYDLENAHLYLDGNDLGKVVLDENGHPVFTAVRGGDYVIK